jgi:hypothetical protein
VKAQTLPDSTMWEVVRKHNKEEVVIPLKHRRDTIPLLMPSDVIRQGIDSQYVIRPVDWKFKVVNYLPALGGALISGFSGAMYDKQNWEKEAAMSVQTIGLSWTVALNPSKSANKPGWIKWIAEPLAYFAARQLSYYSTYNLVK